MSLCVLVTLSAVESHETIEKNRTVHIKNGTAFTNVTCGIVQSGVAMEWFIYKDHQWAKMMKCYNDSSKHNYYNNYTNYNYECVNTSLVIKNINLSVLLKCNSVGDSIIHSYTTLLQVVGKFIPFILVVSEMSYFFDVYRAFLDFESCGKSSNFLFFYNEFCSAKI